MKERIGRAKDQAPAASKSEREEKPHTLQFGKKDDETVGRAHSRALASPTANAAMTMYSFHYLKGGANVTDLLEELRYQATAIQGGNMERAEAILVAQAHTLDALFNTLAQKAAVNMNAGYLGATDTYLRLALKSQSQSRTTLETLAEIKFPKSATFIKQANIAEQQQVNNDGVTRAREKNITPTNELLTEQPSATLDTGRTGKAGRANPKLATVAKLHRAK